MAGEYLRLVILSKLFVYVTYIDYLYMSVENTHKNLSSVIYYSSNRTLSLEEEKP